jgi:hypothetical protein
MPVIRKRVASLVLALILMGYKSDTQGRRPVTGLSEFQS